MEIHDGVLAYRLLNNSNIAESHKPLIRATLPDDLRYTTMWKQLKECSLKQSPQNQLKLSNQKQNFQSNLRVMIVRDGKMFISVIKGVAFKKENITVAMEVTDIEEN